MTTEIDQVIQAIGTVPGEDLSKFDESFLAKSLETRLEVTGNQTIEGYISYLSDHPGEPEEFYRSLYITYSEFFRNSLTFSELEQHILPLLIEKKKDAGSPEIRVWSAGCAAGQEAYSVAILLDELIGARNKPLSFLIAATDISEAGLQTARNGVYDARDMQNIKLKHLGTYFQSHGETYSVVSRLKDRIDFTRYDLLDEHSTSPPAGIYGDFDLVICSNLLFYYRPWIRSQILDKMYRSLAANGYLVTGEAERDIVEKSDCFQAISNPTAVYRKIRNKKVT